MSGTLRNGLLLIGSLALLDMPKTATFEERRANLMRASQHGLNLRAIVLAVSQKSLSPISYRTIGVLESYNYPEPDHVVREGDAELIRGLEWLTMVSDTFADALVAANAFLRYFYAENKVAAARQVLTSLPSDLANECLAQMQGDAAIDDEMDDVEGEAGLLRNEVLEFKLHAVLSNTLALVEEAERVWQDYDAGALKSERMAWSSRNAVSPASVFQDSKLKVFPRSRPQSNPPIRAFSNSWSTAGGPIFCRPQQQMIEDRRCLNDCGRLTRQL